MLKTIQNLVALVCLSITATLFLTSMAFSATVVKVDRAIHDGFELLIIHCDSLPEFSLDYNRVAGVAELKLKRGKIGRLAAQTLTRFAAGLTIRGTTVDAAKGVIRFRTPKPVYIREYLVSGPPALILDFGVNEQETKRLPFELDREDYLRLGSSAEHSGRLEQALDYVEHVRKWEDSDIALTHKAGVIEQRLGRWDSALETLAESAQIAEFAADAHARRTMIFLAKGDTASMGDEWAGYFHKDKKKPEPTPAETFVDTIAVVQQTAQTAPAKPPKKTSLHLPSVLSAGGGNSLDYLYYGWGFLIVGFLSLIGLLIGARKSTFSKGYYGDIDVRIPSASEDRTYSKSEPEEIIYKSRSNQGEYTGQSSSSVKPQSTINQSVAPIPELTETVIPANRVTASAPAISRSTPMSNKNGRVPVDEIVALAEEGVKADEIAHKLMVGRDEVTMVLNLARMAGRRQSRNAAQIN